MTPRILLGFLTIAAIASVSTASGQETQPSSNSARPGIWYDGRFTGYVPAHERQHDAASQSNLFAKSPSFSQPHFRLPPTMRS